MTVGSWFDAKKDGKCTNCKTPVLAGDQMYAKSRGVYLCESCGGIAQATEGMVSTGGIEEATISDLETFPEEARKTSMAVSMLYLARQLDQGDVSPREVTLYTKELRLLYMQLRDNYPEQTDDDATDQAQSARERRMREQGP
jgi:hypothetical protein